MTRAVESGAAARPVVTGRIHTWDLSTGADGPGTRFVLSVSGCLLRCLYCADPDAWHAHDGWEATVDEVMDRVERYRTFITAAGGGVTLTGGEPLLQPAFTAALLRRCKEAGLHTALDTSGSLGTRAGDALLADTDLVLLDVKSFDVTTYRRLTGGALAPTLNFATRLNRSGVRIWIRYVLVPGWTDDPVAVEGLARFLSGLGNVDRVDVLPFHRPDAAKYEALGRTFPLRGTPVPGPGLLGRVRDQFRAHGLTVG